MITDTCVKRLKVKVKVNVKLSLCFFKLGITPWRHIGKWRY